MGCSLERREEKAGVNLPVRGLSGILSVNFGVAHDWASRAVLLVVLVAAIGAEPLLCVHMLESKPSFPKD